MKRIAAAVAGVLAVSACVTPAPPTSARIMLRPCVEHDVAATCGTVRVFENHATLAGRQIDVHVAVIRASRQPAEAAVFFLAGGPGEGSTELVPVAGGWAGTLRDSLDLVFVDQRGTGASHPLECPSPALTDPAAIFGHVFDSARIAACRDALERDADLTQFTTDAAVADLDDVRHALGYQKISLYGGSYGTRLAQAYLRRFPDAVRSVVLDGVLPFDNQPLLRYGASAQQSLDRVIQACESQPECARTHPHLTRDFAGLLSRLDVGPWKTTVKTPDGRFVPVSMTRGDFGYAVRGALYSARAASSLPDQIAFASTSGDGREFAQMYFDRHVRLGASLAEGLHLSVMCAEEIPFVRDDEIDAATAGTFLGRYLIDEYRNACAVWRRGTVAADFRAPVAQPAPVLLVSGFFDPVTPPEFGDRVAQSLPHALHIVAPHAAHGSTTACPLSAALQVLRTGSLEGMPRGCQ